MIRNLRKRNRALRLALLIGACLVFFAIILFLPAPEDMPPSSTAVICNASGFNVRFEKVIVDDQIVCEAPELTIMSKKDLGKPWLDNRLDHLFIEFRAPDKFVELRIATLNAMQERDTVSCALDNRLRPCFFEVGYQKGRLVCSPCTHWK
ncbi:MAG: hypothetical protein HY913_09000 [Desulfomonile tiedjei]|nr:hypothetical protein [Desulfomonile tiedjei]